MDEIDAKLAQWTKLYDKLEDTRSRLKVAETKGQKTADLKAELADIQRQCGVALDEINAAYARLTGKAG